MLDMNLFTGLNAPKDNKVVVNGQEFMVNDDVATAIMYLIAGKPGNNSQQVSTPSEPTPKQPQSRSMQSVKTSRKKVRKAENINPVVIEYAVKRGGKLTFTVNGEPWTAAPRNVFKKRLDGQGYSIKWSKDDQCWYMNPKDSKDVIKGEKTISAVLDKAGLTVSKDEQIEEINSWDGYIVK